MTTMKKYKVEVMDDSFNPIITEQIEAQSMKDAHKKYVDSVSAENKVLLHRDIKVSYGAFEENVYEPPHFDGQHEEFLKQQLELEKKKVLEAKAFINELSDKINVEGFTKLEAKEVAFVCEKVDAVFVCDEMSNEDLILLNTILSDEKAYRFFSLRTGSRTSLQQKAMLEAMNVNLSNISKKTGGIKMASMFTGMAAARHLGEEIAEDIGGGDDGGGGWEE